MSRPPRALFVLDRPALAVVSAICLVGAHRAAAHEGPPFPLIMDKQTPGYVVSVWADPDIGEARFYVILEAEDGGMPPEPAGVSMWVEPVDGRLERVTYQANRQSLRNRVQYELRPFFDERRQWNVGFRIQKADGQSEEVQAQVESTPPGWGRWDLALYFFPFALLGAAWIVAVVRQRRRRSGEPSVLSSASPTTATASSSDEA